MQHQWPTTRITLLDRLRDTRDELPWRRFVDVYMPLLYQYSVRNGLQDNDAQDVVQEVLVQVYRSFRTFQYNPERGRFRNWLRRITHQRILRLRLGQNSAVRGLGDGQGHMLCDTQQSKLDAVWHDLLAMHLYRSARAIAKSEFDERIWAVFERVWEQGASPHDVAQNMGRKPEWVYYAKFRVLARLKQLVSELADDEEPTREDSEFPLGCET